MVIFSNLIITGDAQIAQSVEQRTENPRVDGSIPSLGTISVMVIYFDTFNFIPVKFIKYFTNILSSIFLVYFNI